MCGHRLNDVPALGFELGGQVKPMDVSVAMATYNGERYLAEQLASITAQTLLPSELVVSDDGSTDATLEIVEAFARTAPFPVTVLRNEKNLGFADNFLHAAEACKCSLIAFADQDDVWLPDKLRQGAARIVNDDSLLSMHTLTVTDEALLPTGFHWDQGIKGDAVHAPLELDPFGTGWGNTMMFRRAVVHVIARQKRPPQPFNSKKPLSHDTWVYVLSAALGGVSHIAAPLILYRQHASNATGQTKSRRRNKLASLMSVPIIEYREHAKFDACMAELFADASLQPTPFAAAALEAANCFARRSAYWSARVGVFDNKTLASRLQAYRETRLLTGHAPLWFGSRMKDLVLGVFGLGSTWIGRALLR
jgi:hypothetical protein